MTTDWPSSCHLNSPRTSCVIGKSSVARYPTGLAGKRAVFSGDLTFTIPSSVQELDGSLSLLHFRTSEDNQYLEASRGAISTHLRAQQRIRAEVAPASLDAHRLRVLEDIAANYMLISLKLAAYPSVEDTTWTTLQSAVTERTSIEEGLRAAIEGINSITATVAEARGATK